MKRFTGQTKSHEVSGSANSVANGDVDELDSIINTAPREVSDDLRPFDRNDTLMCAAF